MSWRTYRCSSPAGFSSAAGSSSTASIGMLLFAGAVAWVDVGVPVQDKLLAAILAGLIQGAGSGIILKSVGSAGGTDILSVILLQRFSIRLGTTVLAFNILVLSAAALLFSLEDALYTLIYLYVSTKIVDLVVTGLSQRKAIFIISPQWEKISSRILNEIHRGVTILRGQGAYSAAGAADPLHGGDLSGGGDPQADRPQRGSEGFRRRVRHDRSHGASHRQPAPLVTALQQVSLTLPMEHVFAEPSPMRLWFERLPDLADRLRSLDGLFHGVGEDAVDLALQSSPPRRRYGRGRNCSPR